MKYATALLSFAILVNFGCSDGPLTAKEAGARIAELDEFKREARFTLNVGRPFQSAFRCYSEAEVASVPINTFVVDRGWVRYERREGNFGFGAKGACPAFGLTPAGARASAQWRQSPDNSGGTIWTVPIGRRELVAVTTLTTTSGGSTQVDFTWRWAPDETGVALRQSVNSARALFDATRTGQASCRRVNHDWRCQLALWTNAAEAAGELAQ